MLFFPSSIPQLRLLSPCPDIGTNPPLKRLAPHRHFQLVKRVLHHIVCVQFIDLPHYNIHIRLLRFRKEKEFGARDGLETRHAEKSAFEDFETGERGAGYRGAYGSRGDGAGDSMDAGRIGIAVSPRVLEGGGRKYEE